MDSENLNLSELDFLGNRNGNLRFGVSVGDVRKCCDCVKPDKWPRWQITFKLQIYRPKNISFSESKIQLGEQIVLTSLSTTIPGNQLNLTKFLIKYDKIWCWRYLKSRRKFFKNINLIYRIINIYKKIDKRKSIGKFYFSDFYA